MRAWPRMKLPNEVYIVRHQSACVYAGIIVQPKILTLSESYDVLSEEFE